MPTTENTPAEKVDQTYLGVWLGNDLILLPANEILAIEILLDEMDIVSIPQSPPPIRGMVCRDGQMITIIEMNKLYDTNANITSLPCHLMVVNYKGFTYGLSFPKAGKTQQIADESWQDIPESNYLIVNHFGLLHQVVLDGHIGYLCSIEQLLSTL